MPSHFNPLRSADSYGCKAAHFQSSNAALHRIRSYPTLTNMRLHLLPTVVEISARMPPSSPSPKPRKSCGNGSANICKHYPSATLDILILIIVLFSGSFLVTSYFSYIFHFLSLLLPPIMLACSDSIRASPLTYVLGISIFFTVFFLLVDICCGYRWRKCGNSSCKGLRKSIEFDLQLQSEDCLKSASSEIDRLPWKGGHEDNPHYECLRAELRKMAPPNGRAILLFRERCGCPVSKLVGWGPKRNRRWKKSLPGVDKR